MGPPATAPTVALLHWGALIEDFLEPAGLSFEDFRTEVTGGWMFNYVEALRLAGVRTVLVCVARSVDRPTRLRHEPTGTAIIALPPPRPYAALRALTVRERGDAPLEGSRAQVAKSPLARLSVYGATPLLPLGRALRAEGCRALLCQEYEYPRFDVCVGLGRALGLPVFATYQGAKGGGSAIERVVRRLTVPRAKGLIVVSEEEAERARAEYALPDRRLVRLFNPVDLSVWHPGGREEGRARLGIDSGARVVVWHGRVKLWEKGLDVLAEAWRRVARERPTARLVLVGTGDDAPRLRLLLAELGIEDRVTWIDRYVLDRPRMRELLCTADVSVLASRQEGSPVACLEAMACGLAIVAADASGVPDILAGGEADGGVVVPREDPEALAGELGRLLDDPPLCAELGGRARRRVEEGFSLEAIGPALREVLLGDQAGR